MKRNIVSAAVTAAALAGGGTATALATSGDDDARETTRQAAETRASDDDTGDDDADDGTVRTDAAAAKVSVAEALAAALRDTPGTAVSADLDGNDEDGDDNGDDGDGAGGHAAWEVDVLSGDGTWHGVRIDPATGKVLGSHPDDEDDTAEVRAALKGTSVDAAEAARAAAAHGTVTSVELDDDSGDDGNGEAAWEVGTRASGKAGGQDWRVDLKTGKVTADHSDDADADPDSDDGDCDCDDD